MVYGKAEDAGGLSPAKDDNEAMRHFIRRTLPILDCVDYNLSPRPSGGETKTGIGMLFPRPKGGETRTGKRV